MKTGPSYSIIPQKDAGVPISNPELPKDITCMVLNYLSSFFTAAKYIPVAVFSVIHWHNLINL